MRYSYLITTYFDEPFKIEGTDLRINDKTYAIIDSYVKKENDPKQFGNIKQYIVNVPYVKWTAPFHTIKMISSYPVGENK